MKPPVGAHGEKEPLAATSSVSVRKAEISEPSRLYGEVSVRPRKEVEPSSLSSVPHSKPGLGVSSTSSASSGSLNVESDAHNSVTPASAPVESSESVLASPANEAKNKVVVPGQVKDIIHDEPGNTGEQDQVFYCLFIRPFASTV